MAASEGDSAYKVTPVAPRPRLRGELRFPSATAAISGDLLHAPDERSTLTLQTEVNFHICRLPGTVGVLHIVTSEGRYSANVQIEVDPPSRLQLHLIGRPRRTDHAGSSRQPSTVSMRYRELSVAGQSPVWRLGVASNLSEDGLGLLVCRALWPGQTIEVALPLGPTQRQMALHYGLDLRSEFLPLPAHIHYCVAAPEGRWRITVRFTALTSAERRTLRNLLPAHVAPSETDRSEDDTQDLSL